jgi:hypothetical protein
MYTPRGPSSSSCSEVICLMAFSLLQLTIVQIPQTEPSIRFLPTSQSHPRLCWHSPGFPTPVDTVILLVQASRSPERRRSNRQNGEGQEIRETQRQQENEYQRQEY